jgi:hypothetical protein
MLPSKLGNKAKIPAANFHGKSLFLPCHVENPIKKIKNPDPPQAIFKTVNFLSNACLFTAWW